VEEARRLTAAGRPCLRDAPCLRWDLIMLRRLTRWLAPLLIALAWPLAAARGQGAGEPEAESSPPVPALQTVVATVATALVLVILCKPSRKS
jgi:hypothetical protein